jgi:hypothetical protein
VVKGGVDFDEINRILDDWRQGDVVLGAGFPFLHLADVRLPLTPQALELAGIRANDSSPYMAVPIDVVGFVVLSQTCDIILPCQNRPMIQVATLEQVDAKQMPMIKTGQNLRRLFIPALETKYIAANPDFVMTVEKSVLAKLDKNLRIRGVTNEHELLMFAQRITRRFERFAFPSEFVAAMQPIRTWLDKKVGKNSAEGRLYNSVQEIRAECFPSWNSLAPDVTLMFIFEDRRHITEEAERLIDGLIRKFKPTDHFDERPDFQLLTHEDVTARRYLETVPLELDYLSTR